MSLVLTDFMQTVSLQDPRNPKSFLVLANEDGEELRVPVGPDAIEAITRFAFSDKAKMEKPPVPEEEDEGAVMKDEEEDLEEDPDATQFGGDVEEGSPDEDDDPIKKFELPPSSDVPDSEEKVPSL